jgi:hypothetical protein
VTVALTLQFTFGTVVIFTMQILSIHEYGRSFHFLVSSSMSFFQSFTVFRI